MTEPDFNAITARQRFVWSEGDFARIGVMAVIVGELLCEAVDVLPGERVLDVAAGSGNTALAAARRWADVTATDFVPHLLETAARRAVSEGLPLVTEVADAQSLPYPDGSFDVVLSTFGAMFAPDQERTAAELVRVCRPGGRIGMANWAPEGMVGEMFGITASHVPPPPGIRPPADWGRRQRLEELFGDAISELRIERRQLVFRWPSVEQALEYFRTWFGPTKVAFESLDPDGQAALGRDLMNVWRKHSRSDTVLAAPGDYLEVVAVRS
ncbi:MAG: class I SAM-dependent methyltransferase [Acidimicrobiia bacterium]